LKYEPTEAEQIHQTRPSRKLLASVGFREVGTYEKHARLDGGEWRGVVMVERLILANLAPPPPGAPSNAPPKSTS